MRAYNNDVLNVGYGGKPEKDGKEIVEIGGSQAVRPLVAELDVPAYSTMRAPRCPVDPSAEQTSQHRAHSPVEAPSSRVLSLAAKQNQAVQDTPHTSTGGLEHPAPQQDVYDDSQLTRNPWA
jgi:hypothetical protein